MTDKLTETFNETMESSKQYANENSCIDYQLSQENGAYEFIESITYSYANVREFKYKMGRGKIDTYYCAMIIRELSSANSYLISALHAGLINCVDGKFTISEKVKNV